MISLIKRYAWTFPFIFFLCGYGIMRWYSAEKSITAPNLVGMSLDKVILNLSSSTIIPRIIKQQEEPDLPEGTVLSQTPQPGQSMKPRQSLFLVVSKKPTPVTMPNCIGQAHDSADQLLQTIDNRHQIYPLPSKHPQGSCFAQYPTAMTPLDKYDTIILYCAAKTQQPCVFPSFYGQNTQHVIEFLSLYGITPHITPAVSQNMLLHTIVNDQRPLPGTIIHLDHPEQLHIVLQVVESY